MDRKVLEVSCLSLSFPLFLFVSLSFSDYLPTYLPTDLSVYLSICLPIHPSIDLSIYMSIYLSIYLSISISLSPYLSTYLPIYLSIFLSFLSIYLSYLSIFLIYLSFLTYLSFLPIYLSYLSIYLAIYLSIWRALFRHLNLQKWSESIVFFNILTCKCASRHNGVHFFDISTSKGGPTLVCFVHFDLQMCFAPQRVALFRHLNFQKWSESIVFF